MSDLTAVKVPDIGDFKDVEVIEVLVNVGDTIEPEQSLITVESDKASMEIPATTGGVVKKIEIKIGDKINQGSVILQVEGASAADAKPAKEEAKVEKTTEATTETTTKDQQKKEPQQKAEAKPETQQKTPPETQPEPNQEQKTSPTASIEVPSTAGQLPHASPSVRKFARELGVDLTAVKGSGAKGRITQEDVQLYVKAALQGGGAAASAPAGGSSAGGLNLLAWPKVDFSKFGAIETKPLSRIKKISGANLHRNWVMIPHVTNNDEADITELEALRVQLNKENEKSGVKVTMLAFLMKAVVAALKKYPEFNASVDGDRLVLKQYYNIGFAADTPNGLVVPVITDADKKGVIELAQETSAMAKLAREGKLSPTQMQGGCMSISSLGGIGGTHFTPIINAPEVAILGVSKSYQKPVWDGKAFVPRLTLPLSLSYDHRVIDGASAARFNAYLGALLADFRRIIL
jgi:pyruvate dehydrogenase E2 component (dihydrolipoamide acetyltransferase)